MPTEAVLRGEIRYNGLVFEHYEVKLAIPCPGDDCPGQVRYEGDALVYPDEWVCYLIGVSCDFCDATFLLDFELVPDPDALCCDCCCEGSMN